MSVIENFSALSEKELRQFADALIEKINREQIFSSELEFKLVFDRYSDEKGIRPDDMTGDVTIDVIAIEDGLPEGTIEVRRPAHWTGTEAQSEYDDNELKNTSDAEFLNLGFDDIEERFKTTEAVIDGYSVRLSITDYDTGDIVDVEVDSYESEDSGAGSIPYGDTWYHDSHPYLAIDGTLTQNIDVAFFLHVQPVDKLTEDLCSKVDIKKADLPEWEGLSDEEKEEILSDYLSDTYGFLHNGFSYEESGDIIKITNIAWEVDDDEDYED